METATPECVVSTPSRNLEGLLADVVCGLQQGKLLPYLGAGAVLLEPANQSLPMRPEALASILSKRTAVPARLRKNLTGAAQYIENFRHRKVLRGYMRDAFAQPAVPSALHRWLISLKPPLVVDTGYDAASAIAFQEAMSEAVWGQVQGISRAEIVGVGGGDQWVGYFDAEGQSVSADKVPDWLSLLYKPFGCVSPGGHFLVSDSDFVEVLTEIDIQTPIPPGVQLRRSGRGFLFLGCRFDDQLARTYARQIMKRSGGRHFVVMEEEPTRNEAKFIAEQGISRLPISLSEFFSFSQSL